MVILETNTLPIHEIKICNGLCENQYHTGNWCQHKDYYSRCSYIDTPNTDLANAYDLLRQSRLILLDVMFSNNEYSIIGIKQQVHQIKELIKLIELKN